MYQDRWLWKELIATLSYAEVMALSDTADRVAELNKAPVEYYDKFSEEWHIVNNHLEDDEYTQRDELNQVWVEWEK